MVQGAPERPAYGGDQMLTGLGDLLRYTHATAIVGDILKMRASDIGLGDMAIVELGDGEQSLAQVIQLEGEEVSLQVFGGGKGLSTQATVRFLGHPTQVTYSSNSLGRVFRGDGEPIDGGPDLSGDRQADIGGPSVNPVTRIVPSKMIRTNVPMIDVFNCLVESQKIPIFSVSGEPFNQLLARIGIQADADVIVFGGMGLIFDDYYFFRKAFEEAGMFTRTVMFVNQASDPVVERLLIPDLGPGSKSVRKDNGAMVFCSYSMRKTLYHQYPTFGDRPGILITKSR